MQPLLAQTDGMQEFLIKKVRMCITISLNKVGLKDRREREQAQNFLAYSLPLLQPIWHKAMSGAANGPTSHLIVQNSLVQFMLYLPVYLP